MNDRLAHKPWYQHPMVWLVICIPMMSVVSGIYFIVIATGSPNDVVNDDYYKAGLAINQRFEQDRQAAKMGLVAKLRVKDQRINVTLNLTKTPYLGFDLLHINDSDQDIHGGMARLSEGQYQFDLLQEIKGRWYIELYGDSPKPWRLRHRIDLPLVQTLTILPQER